ncbi:hypothetical protein E2C01_026203 [Portunus trituberculatus]|uniref:Uncharacterized protein n=1 Tax=Portunus trituberculatus TaxID=210409 RepID=A0A5B7EEU5_PORTR|nr:hypothetical protein [Portunus trituberculatus]
MLANLEAEKKVSMLLTLSGLTEGELKVFLRDARRTTIVKQRLPPHLRMLYSKLREELPKPTPGHPGNEAIGRSGSYTDLTKTKSTCELKDLRRENDLLKTEAAEAEDLRVVYEAQCLQMEQRMCKLREEKEANEQTFKVKTTMSDVKTKTIDKGYDDLRGEDDLKKEGSRTPLSGERGEEEACGRGRGIGTFWRRLCCCWDAYPQHPLLPASVVTHRKISRVVSTESLKENTEMDTNQTINMPLDLPLDQMTPQEKLHHVRALNRLYSSSLSASSTQSIPLDLLQPSAAKYSQKSNGSISSPGSARRFPSTPSASPRPARPTQLSLASSSTSSKSSSTPTPTAGSNASTPSTPRSRSGSWGMVKAGFSSLMRAVTPTSRPESSLFAPDENDESDASDEEPEAVRPATGGLDNPTRECYGAVKLAVLGWQGRWVRIGICGLEGLPWVGGSGGIMLEVCVDPGGRSRWLALPHAHGPSINVKVGRCLP